MKKFAVVLMSLVLCMMLVCTAVAEEKMFAMTTVTDLEGNILATLTEDGFVVDAEGNDISEEFPVLVVWMNDEDMTCAFGTEEEAVAGTMEILEETEEGVAVEMTLEDGEVIDLVYTVEGMNAVTYVDEENGMMFIMPEIAMEETEAAE